jgi:hypothetical protein
VRVSDLPISYWEDKERGLNNVIRLENLIKENGFDGNSPILLSAWTDNRIVLDGGHHRVQALRNLINEGFLSREFKIPAIMRFRKKWFYYQKKGVNLPLNDYSRNIDELRKLKKVKLDQSIWIVLSEKTFYLNIDYLGIDQGISISKHNRSSLYHIRDDLSDTQIFKIFQLLKDKFGIIRFDSEIYGELITDNETGPILKIMQNEGIIE